MSTSESRLSLDEALGVEAYRGTEGCVGPGTPLRVTRDACPS